MQPTMKVQLPQDWRNRLGEELEKPYFQKLSAFVDGERQAYEVFPPEDDVFNALNTTPYEKVNVLLLGQDPYHGPGQAHGLCFSVQNGVPPPPSLINIFKELHSDIGVEVPRSGNLTKWAQHGVFLLNASLTVRAGEPMSHAKIGWATFTDTVIKKISDKKEHVVFMLWGKFAQEKKILIDETRHCILKTVHPSPLSASGGFFGCKHFSKANAYMVSKGIDPIDWSLL